MKQSCKFVPRDLLFFRDGRPIDVDKNQAESRNVGHGAYWPRPDHLYNGMMHALLNDRTAGGKRFSVFGSLKTEGPFPMKGDTLYLPRPLDWDCRLVEVVDTDLPAFLTHGFIDNEEGKKDYPAWISAAEYHAYLNSERASQLKKEDLFQCESRIGTTLDAETGASERKAGRTSGQYQAEYLRLARNVSLWGSVDCKDDELSRNGVKGIPATLILGGQGGLVSRETCTLTLDELFKKPSVKAASDGACHVRWTLLAPAYFSQTGWLPGWCRDTSDKKRPEGEVCYDGCAGVKLIAACTGKPTVFSGWDTETGVKSTKLAVPAGSCYVFKCPDAQRAAALVDVLHLQRKSDFGSQGFGLGVCSFISL